MTEINYEEVKDHVMVLIGQRMIFFVNKNIDGLYSLT